MLVLQIFIGIIAIFLIITVLLQQSQDDIQDAFSGEKSELFKNRKSRGFEKMISISSGVLGVLLVILVLVSNALFN